MRHGWFLVNNKKNSKCPSAKLSELDYSTWYFLAPFYLHIHREEDDTYHRVYPKKKRILQVGMSKGKLYWVR